MNPIESLMASVDWKAAPEPFAGDTTLPYATHSGVLEIGEMRLRCYRLNTGEAILDADDVRNFFGGLLS